MAQQDSDYLRGRAGAAEGTSRNRPSRGFIGEIFESKADAERLKQRQAKYDEGRNDKLRELKKRG